MVNSRLHSSRIKTAKRYTALLHYNTERPLLLLITAVSLARTDCHRLTVSSILREISVFIFPA